MALFTLTHLPTGRVLGTIDASTTVAAIEHYLTEHPESGMQPTEIAAAEVDDDERIARIVSSNAEGIVTAMHAGAHDALESHTIRPEAHGATLVLRLEHEQLASFTLIDPERGAGRGAGLLFGCFSWRAAVNFGLLVCCSSENLAGCPEAYFSGGVFIPPAKRTELRKSLTVADGFVAAWSRCRGPLADVTRD